MHDLNTRVPYLSVMSKYWTRENMSDKNMYIKDWKSITGSQLHPATIVIRHYRYQQNMGILYWDCWGSNKEIQTYQIKIFKDIQHLTKKRKKEETKKKEKHSFVKQSKERSFLWTVRIPCPMHPYRGSPSKVEFYNLI